VCLAVVVFLAPFARKAYHIDDPLFVWAAQHIQQHPLDPYGFTVNWNGWDQPMSEVTKNPPLTCYYLAAAGAVLGWSEFRLHAAMMLPAVMAILGTFLLAARLCDRPVEASLAALLTPVFLISATSVMCDVTMLAFWVWAVLLWIKGIDEDKLALCVTSALLMGLCMLTKYFGAVVLPLCLVYGLMRKRGLGKWTLPLILPILIAAAYYLGTSALYGRNLFADAVSYATDVPQVPFERTIVGMAFLGGCMAFVGFCAPQMWSRRALAAWGILCAIVIAGLWLMGPVPGVCSGFDPQNAALVRVQMGLMVAVGVSVLLLPILDFARRRDAESVMLMLWVLGTFVFASLVNWSVNGRSVLPMAPAVAILVVRQANARRRGAASFAIPLVLTALLTFWAAQSDLVAAASARTAANESVSRFGNRGSELWFDGHWGFQYYIQRHGARPIDASCSVIPEGAVIFQPAFNTQTVPFPPECVEVECIMDLQVSKWMATHSVPQGAGFYSSVFGALPYVAAPQKPEPYAVLIAKHAIHFPCQSPQE
jgi:4-amino-4-deoxy-L-arabinose transferase-like glycosyltransferase